MNSTDQLIDTLKNKAAKDGAFAIAFSICELANAQRSTAAALGRLGNADACTPFGAIEALSGQAGKIASRDSGVVPGTAFNVSALKAASRPLVQTARF